MFSVNAMFDDHSHLSLLKTPRRFKPTCGLNAEIKVPGPRPEAKHRNANVKLSRSDNQCKIWFSVQTTGICMIEIGSGVMQLWNMV